MKKLLIIISFVNLLIAIDTKPAITISKQSVDDILKEYNKTLIVIEDTKKSIDQYHNTLKTSIDSLKKTYNEISPDISDKTQRVISSIEDINSTVKVSMDIINKNINDYYIIEIVAFIAFLISINNILEIIIKLRRFRFIRNWLKSLTTYWK
jgi:hypothetical protein